MIDIHEIIDGDTALSSTLLSDETIEDFIPMWKLDPSWFRRYSTYKLLWKNNVTSQQLTYRIVKILFKSIEDDLESISSYFLITLYNSPYYDILDDINYYSSMFSLQLRYQLYLVSAKQILASRRTIPCTLVWMMLERDDISEEQISNLNGHIYYDKMLIDYTLSEFLPRLNNDRVTLSILKILHI